MSFVFGFLIYLFIFMYGSMVMRGVIEEKSNRIVEVIISSVKPFQLLIGKIIGVAMVGFTQFILWILLSIIVANIAEMTFIENSQLGLFENISMMTTSINISLLFSSFIFILWEDTYFTVHFLLV